VSVAPVIRDEQSAPFFDAAAAGELLLRRCRSCRGWSAPSDVVCSICRSGDLGWEPGTRRGRLVSWTVIPGKPKDGAEDVCVGLVEVVEGPWLTLRLHGHEEVDPREGAPVDIDFEQPDGGEALPVGRLSGEGESP
jgi:uncharacterized protein